MMGDIDMWMPLVIGAYLADTPDLSCEEHGAYLLLLMDLWRRRGRLPLDHVRLARVVRLTPERWATVWETLGRFFQIEAGHITQRRLLRELDRATKQRAVATERARKAAGKRWHPDAPHDAQALLEQSSSTSQALLDQCPSPQPSEEDPDPDMRSRKRKRAEDGGEDFKAFYAAYPRKRSRGEAIKAWHQTAHQRPALPVLLVAVERLKREQRPIDKTPYPASWLRALGWEDEAPVAHEPNGTAAVLDESERRAMERYK